VLAALLLTTLAAPNLTKVRVELAPAHPRLDFEKPVRLLQAPGDAEHWYLVEQPGRVRRFATTDAKDARVVIDIRARVNSKPTEAGLLGMAFHPRWPADRRVVLSYTTGERPLRSIIAIFDATADAIDPASEKRLLALDQPYSNHNGGDVDFGPDGFLYIGFGDGGSAGDPQGNGQNTTTLLGKILRIDVDKPSAGKPYGIPADNPFAKGGGAPEIYAWGLRNPWTMRFDGEALWVADVGQYLWEEVVRVERGKNYGWNVREGRHCYERERCATEGLVEPIVEYSHRVGQSITGGAVYRGSAIPALAGAYVYADFATGRIWAIDASGAPQKEGTLLLDSEASPSDFGVDAAGELYLLDYYEGAILKLVGARQ
jgi:glucose/arabinose dehydrogenase